MEDTDTKRFCLLFALLLCLCMTALAEETPPEEPSQGHNASHHTVERMHGGPSVQPVGSQDGHHVVTWYDLYCEDCHQVIEENVRSEETVQAHSWSAQRQEPTCLEEGREILTCSLCGEEYEQVLPLAEHIWSEWEDVSDPTLPVCLRDVIQTRSCIICGLEDSRQEPAPGHQWIVSEMTEPTCVKSGVKAEACSVCGAERKEEIPALGHFYAPVSILSGKPEGNVGGGGQYIGKIAGVVLIPNSCEEAGRGQMICVRCQESRIDVSIPATGHTWGDWIKDPIPEGQGCVTDEVGTHVCQVCGASETAVLKPAPGHKWEAVSYVEPSCTQDGMAMRRCKVCGLEEIIPAPALGHCYMWLDGNETGGVSQYVCLICGDVQGQAPQDDAHIYYNNTITSFGPTTRELIGGSVWNRVTPVDLSEEGVFTYPLVASNMFTVGTVTMINDQGQQIVNYKLSSSHINVHAESLVVYPNLESLKTGENAVAFDFDTPLNLEAFFGDDRQVIIAITLKADYDANSSGVQYFLADQKWIKEMVDMVD